MVFCAPAQDKPFCWSVRMTSGWFHYSILRFLPHTSEWNSICMAPAMVSNQSLLSGHPLSAFYRYADDTYCPWLCGWQSAFSQTMPYTMGCANLVIHYRYSICERHPFYQNVGSMEQEQGCPLYSHFFAVIMRVRCGILYWENHNSHNIRTKSLQFLDLPRLFRKWKLRYSIHRLRDSPCLRDRRLVHYARAGLFWSRINYSVKIVWRYLSRWNPLLCLFTCYFGYQHRANCPQSFWLFNLLDWIPPRFASSVGGASHIEHPKLQRP